MEGSHGDSRGLSGGDLSRDFRWMDPPAELTPGRLWCTAVVELLAHCADEQGSAEISLGRLSDENRLPGSSAIPVSV